MGELQMDLIDLEPTLLFHAMEALSQLSDRPKGVGLPRGGVAWCVDGRLKRATLLVRLVWCAICDLEIVW